MGDNNKEEEFSELDWINIQKNMGPGIFVENSKEKFIRKFKENPFVPIGCLATAGALIYGLWSFRMGKRKMSQYMMRTRIAAQGFTVMALVIGIGMSAAKGNDQKALRKD